MKRSILFFALFALVVAPLDLQGADAQELAEEDLFNHELEVAETSAKLPDLLSKSIDILRDTSKTPDERDEARDAVRKILANMFDADVARRRDQIEKLRTQVSELTTQLDEHEKSRDEMVKFRLLLLDQEISGKTAFPKEWDLLSDSTGSRIDDRPVGPAWMPGPIRNAPAGTGIDDRPVGQVLEPRYVPAPMASRDAQPITNSIGMKLVHIPKGELTAENGKIGVTGEDYFLGQTEVTQGQWRSVMETEPWKGQKHVKEGDDYPANFVSYDDAVKFCGKLSIKDGKGYRLPTDVEWEYACRAGSTTAFSFGDSEVELGEYAWFEGNSLDEPFAHQVAKKRPNAWGLYDMHGNVLEWLINNREGNRRAFRGGCWWCTARDCRSAYRFWNWPDNRLGSLGFRVALVPAGRQAIEAEQAAAEGGGTEVAPAELRPESP